MKHHLKQYRRRRSDLTLCLASQAHSVTALRFKLCTHVCPVTQASNPQHEFLQSATLLLTLIKVHLHHLYLFFSPTTTTFLGILFLLQGMHAEIQSGKKKQKKKNSPPSPLPPPK